MRQAWRPYADIEIQGTGVKKIIKNDPTTIHTLSKKTINTYNKVFQKSFKNDPKHIKARVKQLQNDSNQLQK